MVTATLAASAAAIVTFLTALLGFVFGKKQRDADAEATNVKTALELNARLEAEVGGLRALVNEQRQRLEASERRERLRNRSLARHEAWDLRVTDKLRNAGIQMPDPPSLTDDDTDPHGPRTRAEDYGLPGTRQHHS